MICIACICGGVIELGIAVWLTAVAKWLYNKIKNKSISNCCCECHKEHKKEKEQ